MRLGNFEENKSHGRYAPKNVQPVLSAIQIARCTIFVIASVRPRLKITSCSNRPHARSYPHDFPINRQSCFDFFCALVVVALAMVLVHILSSACDGRSLTDVLRLDKYQIKFWVLASMSVVVVVVCGKCGFCYTSAHCVMVSQRPASDSIA